MQNTLLIVTRNEILERMMLEKASIYDPTIFRAIEVYLQQESIQHQALSFVRELTPIFEEKQKEQYIQLFQKYLEIENGIETFSKKHVSHINHVIQEFLIGYNILNTISIPFIFSEELKYREDVIKDIFFAWMIAALFHDTGYDIERFEEEEKYREMKNEYWSFLTKRQITQDGIQINLKSSVIKQIENKLISRYNEYFSQNCNYSTFLQTFEYNNSYDHAFVSSLKYFSQLVELQNVSGGNYLDWEPNYNAIFAMLLHNFKHKEVDIELSFINEKHFLPYLLIICDEIEYWERNRVIDTVDSISKIKIELDNASFKSEYSYFIINHIVISECDTYKEKLFESILESNKVYPVNIIRSELLNKIYEDIDRSITKNIQEIFTRDQIKYLFEKDYRNFTEIATDHMVDILKLNRKKYETNRKLEDISSEKKILIPSGKYKVIVEHRVNQSPFITYELLL